MKITGGKDSFLRCRDGREVMLSGLSCGCGDDARAFLYAIRGQPVTAVFVDAAEVSSASLISTFSGHAIVAIREQGDSLGPWCLIDTTNLKILSRNWSAAEKSFTAFGCVFWIGYCGPLEKYPVHTPEELKQFYSTTIATIPSQVLAATLIRLDFVLDPSLRNPDNSLVNPRLQKFMSSQQAMLQKRSIAPNRTVQILLKRGADDARSDILFSKSAGWVAHIGTQSSCSSSLLDYFESNVRRVSVSEKEAALVTTPSLTDAAPH